jgi:hypothetical protein
MIQNITIEQWERLEQERFQTQLDPQFQEWMKEMNVSRLCSKREGIDRANQMMEDWDTTKISKTVHTFNFTK